MKKIILLIVWVALVWVQQMNAQVGINPTASDSSAIAKDTAAERFLIPGADRQKTQDMIHVSGSFRICVNRFMTRILMGTTPHIDTVRYDVPV